MKPRIPWLRVFVEGVVIVGSILLAFGIDAWWDGVQEREIERVYLTRLHAELSGGVQMVRDHHARQVRTIAAMDTLLALGGDQDLVGHANLPRTVLNAGSYELSPNSVVFDETYGEMLATGTLGLVSDPEIRQAITAYYRLAGSLNRNVEQASAEGYKGWGNRLRTAMGTLPRSWFSEEPEIGQTIGLAFEPTPHQAQRLLALVASDTGWADEVRYTRTRVESIEFLMVRFVEATDSLIQTLADLEMVGGRQSR